MPFECEWAPWIRWDITPVTRFYFYLRQRSINFLYIIKVPHMLISSYQMEDNSGALLNRVKLLRKWSHPEETFSTVKKRWDAMNYICRGAAYETMTQVSNCKELNSAKEDSNETPGESTQQGWHPDCIEPARLKAEDPAKPCPNFWSHRNWKNKHELF